MRLAHQPDSGRSPQPSFVAALAPTRIRDPAARASAAERACQILVLALLYALPSLLCVRDACVIDPDLWWHLRTAEWILQHRAVPHTDAFSIAAGAPWAAYTWLFDLLLLGLFKGWGLQGIVAFTAGMVLAITGALHRLIRRLQSDFTLAVCLVLVTSVTLFRLYTPRPWLVSILFFVLELDLLMHARRSGRVRGLAWLPLLFALWANVHIQFLDGLLLLALVVAETAGPLRISGRSTRLRLIPVLIVFVACLLATLLNPYGLSIYRVAYDLAAQHGVLDKIAELQAMPFRGLPDYALLFLALAASAALARSKVFPAFEAALLAIAAVISFRSQRDVWFMAASAAAILAPRVSATFHQPPATDLPEVFGGFDNAIGLRSSPLPRFAAPAALFAAGLVILTSFRVLRVDRTLLEFKLAGSMPVVAVKVVQQQHLDGPIFNDYNWGGYLMWKLRQPVSMDGRASLQGDARIDRSVATWNGAPDWASDPDLVAARLIVGPVRSPLTQLLRTDRHFSLIYEDKTASVFVRSNLDDPRSSPD